MATPAAYDIRPASRQQDPILRNLLGLYCHDMAQWFQFDANADGSYSYPTEQLWSAGHQVYLAWARDIPVGFALVDTATAESPVPGAHDVHEFFVVRRHRRHGLGGILAEHIWRANPGPWLVRVYQRNLPALPFWRGAVHSHSNGQCKEQVLDIDGQPWSWFTFTQP